MGVFRLNGKAVSEVLGYILVLSVVVATITVIYAAGMPAIRSQEDIAVFRSMENTFYVLQNVERLVAYNITPEKAVTVRAEGGSIAVIPDWGWINITVRYGSGNGKVVFSFNKRYGAIIYIKNNNKAIILDNGAVLEYYGSSCLMTAKPRFLKVVDLNNGLNLYFSFINASGRISFVGYKSLTFKNSDSCLYQFSNDTTSPRNLTIQFAIKKAYKLGFNSTLIERTILQYINKSLFNGKAKFISPDTIKVIIQKSGNPKKRLIYNYLNITICYYNVTVSG